ncbi:MAG: SWIM zinc finger family protein [Candidatus Omnitrophota bacterium]
MRKDVKPDNPAGKQQVKAAAAVARRVKKGVAMTPVRISGRSIVDTFWGKAWCAHLESFSDYTNRLPRGRLYVRSGFVIHLAVSNGRVEALVQGARLYKVRIGIDALEEDHWQKIVRSCSGGIGSVIELLQGKLSAGVMRVMVDRHYGFFPEPKEIMFSCSCPDVAGMCKHVAAVLYGVGHRLDDEPELLFRLRGVNPRDLVGSAAFKLPAARSGKAKELPPEDLTAVFGIDIVEP